MRCSETNFDERNKETENWNPWMNRRGKENEALKVECEICFGGFNLRIVCVCVCDRTHAEREREGERMKRVKEVRGREENIKSH